VSEAHETSFLMVEASGSRSARRVSAAFAPAGLAPTITTSRH
jgi:hypothetical protein